MEGDIIRITSHVKFESPKAVVGRVMEPEKSSKMALKVLTHKNLQLPFSAEIGIFLTKCLSGRVLSAVNCLVSQNYHRHALKINFLKFLNFGFFSKLSRFLALIAQYPSDSWQG